MLTVELLHEETIDKYNRSKLKKKNLIIKVLRQLRGRRGF